MYVSCQLSPCSYLIGQNSLLFIFVCYKISLILKDAKKAESGRKVTPVIKKCATVTMICIHTGEIHEGREDMTSNVVNLIMYYLMFWKFVNCDVTALQMYKLGV